MQDGWQVCTYDMRSNHINNTLLTLFCEIMGIMAKMMRWQILTREKHDSELTRDSIDIKFQSLVRVRVDVELTTITKPTAGWG